VLPAQGQLEQDSTLVAGWCVVSVIKVAKSPAGRKPCVLHSQKILQGRTSSPEYLGALQMRP
jgi:hypothetical protein